MLKPRCGAALLLLAPLMASAQELPKKYALLIGIDTYLHESVMASSSGIPKLEFAARDALHLKQRLESQGYEATELRNENANRRTVVMQLLRHAAIVREEDTFILYYAGHGVQRQKTKTVYWLNHDGDPTYPDVDGLRVKALIELVNEIPARRKLILLDHCYAGQLEEGMLATTVVDSTGARAGGEPTRRLTLARDAMPADVETMIAQNARGMVFVAASRGLAFEVTDDKHGVFTAALLSAITTPRPDLLSQDGNLSIGEITDFLYKEVKRLSSNKNFAQEPVSQIVSANESEMRTWEPLMRSLSGDEVTAAAQRYRTKLSQWGSQERIPASVRADCEGVINRWEQTPAALSPTDEKIVFLLRQYIDSPPAAEEALISSTFAQRVEYYRESQ